MIVLLNSEHQVLEAPPAGVPSLFSKYRIKIGQSTDISLVTRVHVESCHCSSSLTRGSNGAARRYSEFPAVHADVLCDCARFPQNYELNSLVACNCFFTARRNERSSRESCQSRPEVPIGTSRVGRKQETGEEGARRCH